MMLKIIVMRYLPERADTGSGATLRAKLEPSKSHETKVQTLDTEVEDFVFALLSLELVLIQSSRCPHFSLLD